jgi:hypothetical protein
MVAAAAPFTSHFFIARSERFIWPGPPEHSFIGNEENKLMRSELVFEAVHTLRNRYTLCQLASKATRKFHKPNTRIQDTTNDVLNLIADSERQDVILEPETASEAQRRAA